MKKELLLITVLALITFGNSLPNGFVGDDEVKIVNNHFFSSWVNFRHLFDDIYITESDDYFRDEKSYFSSGEVSYRPVVSASYFLDHWLWANKPFGYHFFNLLIHIFNTIFLFMLLNKVFKKRNVALLSAILFCVHPMKVEAVCAVSFRHDLWAGFFVLSSFIFYIMWRDQNKVSLLGYSAACYFLALFSKESAIGLPIIFMTYDWLLRENAFKNFLKNFFSRYLVFILITLFYLWVYIFIFPNSAISDNKLIGGTVLTHGASILRIFSYYVFDLFIPFFIKTLPPLYAPPIESVFGIKTVIGFLAVGAYCVSLFLSYLRSKIIFFLLLWFGIFYIPISNIFPLANPMSHRFMYLPSIGILSVLAIFLNKIDQLLTEKLKSPYVGKTIKWGFVATCIFITMMLNYSWKDNISLAYGWTQDYPSNSKGFSILGIEYYRKGNCKDAKSSLLKSIDLGSEDPRSYHMIGVCSFDNYKQAESYLQKALELNPHYRSPRQALGILYYRNKEYKEAVRYLTESIEMSPTMRGYKYLILSYKEQKMDEKALLVYDHAVKNMNKEEKETLKKIFDKTQ